jgi:hypothetical protein
MHIRKTIMKALDQLWLFCNLNFLISLSPNPKTGPFALLEAEPAGLSNLSAFMIHPK